MYYLEIVDLFDNITDVKVKNSKIVVTGFADGKRTTYDQEYQHSKVAKEVAKRLMYFKGISKGSKKFN